MSKPSHQPINFGGGRSGRSQKLKALDAQRRSNKKQARNHYQEDEGDDDE